MQLYVCVYAHLHTVTLGVEVKLVHFPYLQFSVPLLGEVSNGRCFKSFADSAQCLVI